MCRFASDHHKSAMKQTTAATKPDWETDEDIRKPWPAYLCGAPRRQRGM